MPFIYNKPHYVHGISPFSVYTIYLFASKYILNNTIISIIYDNKEHNTSHIHVQYKFIKVRCELQ